MKKIVITGSSGFIGSHLINELTKDAFEIIKCDISENVDVSYYENIKKMKADIYIHLAARSFVPASFENPWSFYNTNINSTLNILELARKYSGRVIFLSSYLYGEPVYLPIDELHILQPHNPYAHSKLVCEQLCKAYNKDFNVPVTIFRPFNIFGKGQNESFLIPQIIKQAKTGHIQLKDPRPRRDFIHISDIVSAIIKAVNLKSNQLNILNLGTGKSHSINDIVEIINRHSKGFIKVDFTNDYRKGEVLDTVADISLANKLLEWTPRISLEEGIKLTMV